MATEENLTVEQVAQARREQLRALREARELLTGPNQDSDQTENGDDSSKEKNLNMKFRNYLPHDEQLQKGKLDPPVLPKFEDPIAVAPPPSETIEDPFLNIAPKKPNWDLRRDVQKKLDKLERRTKKAIYQLMEEQEKQNLAGVEENGEESAEA